MSAVPDTEVVVVQPDEGESFWQPVPANGHAEVRVSHRRHPAIQSFATGIQVIAPGCHIREHVHPREEELLFFFEGRGEAVIDGRAYPAPAGHHGLRRRRPPAQVRQHQRRGGAQDVLGDDPGRRQWPR